MLFVDEIHRMSRPAEEMLYLAMEDFRVDVVIGKGPGATAIPLEIPPFTLVGATTRAGPAARTAARPVRVHRAPGVLRARRARPDRAPLRRPARRRRSPPTASAEIAVPLARHAADRQPAAAPGPRLRPGARRRRGHPRRSPARRSSSTRSTSPASTGSTGRCSTCCAAASAADRSASPRSRSRSARSARPSRRSPSRSWCAAACWPARRAAGSPPRPPGSTSASPSRPPATDAGGRRHAVRGLSRRALAEARLHFTVGRAAASVRAPVDVTASLERLFA